MAKLFKVSYHADNNYIDTYLVVGDDNDTIQSVYHREFYFGRNKDHATKEYPEIFVEEVTEVDGHKIIVE